MPRRARLDLARSSVTSLAAMLARVDDDTATDEDERVLGQFEEVIRELADDDDDPRIKPAILHVARAERERQGGERLRPDLRVITAEDGA